MIRDDITASLYGAAFIGNNVLRVMADGMAGLAHLTLQYIDWLSLQLLPDTAETEWLDRHGDIWLTNADGTTGRKQATLATGTVEFTGTSGTVIPMGTRLAGAGDVEYETTAEITIGTAATPAPVRALEPGAASNRDDGSSLSLIPDIPGADGEVTVVELTG